MRLRRTLPTVALASSLLVGSFGLPQATKAQDLHISLGTSDPYYYDGYDGYGESNLGANLLGAFLTGLVNHFGSSQDDVYLLHSRGIHERELPVVFYLARQAGVSPMTIANLRAAGYSWSDITYRLGLTSSIYYVPLSGYYGPYASYYRLPRTRWSTLRLSDDVVIGLVNTRFLSDYYRTPADRVLRLRTSGRDFVTLAREFHRPERHGRLREWNRLNRQRAALEQRQDRLERRDERLDRREAIVRQRARDQRLETQQQRQQQRVIQQRQEANRQAVQRREARQQQEMRQQQRVIQRRQEANRQAVQRREARQQQEMRQQQQRTIQRQEANRQAVQRREARQQRQQQVQERRQGRRQVQAERRQAQRNRRGDD